MAGWANMEQCSFVYNPPSKHLSIALYYFYILYNKILILALYQNVLSWTGWCFFSAFPYKYSSLFILSRLDLITNFSCCDFLQYFAYIKFSNSTNMYNILITPNAGFTFVLQISFITRGLFCLVSQNLWHGDMTLHSKILRCMYSLRGVYSLSFVLFYIT